MTRAIVFLVTPGALVLLDDVAIVFVYREAASNTELLVLAHAEPIEVNLRLGFELVRGTRESLVVLLRARIDRVRMHVGACGQFDLRTGDSQEAQWISVGETACLFDVDDIIGNCRNRRGGGRDRPQRAERIEGRHLSKLCHHRCVGQTQPRRDVRGDNAVGSAKRVVPDEADTQQSVIGLLCL